jgi:hypothetical protein
MPSSMERDACLLIGLIVAHPYQIAITSYHISMQPKYDMDGMDGIGI